MKRNALGVVLGAAAFAAGCGSSSTMGGGGGCPTALTVTISSTGFAPRSSCILAGGTLTLMNADTVEHDVEDPTSTCTPFGTPASPVRIGAGANHTIPLSLPATCGFEDAAHLGDPEFVGTVVIGSGGGGGGY